MSQSKEKQAEIIRNILLFGKKFEERLEQEINARKGKNKKRRTDKEEREKIYKEMTETGVEKTRKGLKKMIERAEKVCLLVDRIGKKSVFESSCDITSVGDCTKKEIMEIAEYFMNVQEMEE